MTFRRVLRRAKGFRKRLKVLRDANFKSAVEDESTQFAIQFDLSEVIHQKAGLRMSLLNNRNIVVQQFSKHMLDLQSASGTELANADYCFRR